MSSEMLRLDDWQVFTDNAKEHNAFFFLQKSFPNLPELVEVLLRIETF
jgi:hypothetical protein